MKAKQNYSRTMLKYKLIILFIAIGIVLDVVMMGISYAVYTADTNESYGKIGSGISQVLASYIEGDDVALWYRGGGYEDYKNVKSTIDRLYQSNSDLKNIYVYEMTSEGMRVLFDAANPDMQIGEVIDYSGGTEAYRSVLMNGGAVEPIIENTTMTTLEPVYNSGGECVCYAGCDISMAELYEERRLYMKNLALLIGIPSLIVVVLVALYVESRIVFPINRVDRYLREYVYDNTKGESVKAALKKLDGTYAKEIVEVKDGAVNLIDSISEYTESVVKFRDSVTKSFEAVAAAKNDTESTDIK